MNKTQFIHTQLGKCDYMLVLKADQEHLLIYYTGDLIRKKTAFILKNARQLTQDNLTNS